MTQLYIFALIDVRQDFIFEMRRKTVRRHRQIRKSSSATVWYLTIAFVLLLTVLFSKNIYGGLNDKGVLGQSVLLAQEGSGNPPAGDGIGQSAPPQQQEQSQQQSQPAPQQQSQLQQQSQPQQQPFQQQSNFPQIQQRDSQQTYQPKNIEEQKQMQQPPEQQKQTYQQYQQDNRPYINPGLNDSGQYKPSQMGEVEKRQEDAATRQYYEQKYQQTGNNTNTANGQNKITPEQKQQMIQQMQQTEQQFRQEAAKNGIQFNGTLPPEALIQQQMMQKYQQTNQRQGQNVDNANTSNGVASTQPINFSSFQALPSLKEFPTISGNFNVQVAGNQSGINLNNANTSIQLGGQNFGLKARNTDGTEVEIDKSAIEKINTAIQLETGVQIEQNQNSVTLKRGLIEAQSRFPISFNIVNKTFTIQTPNGTKEISVLPDQVVEKLLENKIISKVDADDNSKTNGSSVTLTELNNQPVFEVKGALDQKMFGFFPVSVSKTSIVSAESGNVVTTNQNIFSRFLDVISF